MNSANSMIRSAATLDSRLRGNERRERASRREVAEPLEIGLLLRAARWQLEQARGVAAENIVLGLLGEERQVPDSARHVEIPMRVIRCVKELRLRVDHLERAGERPQV